MVDTADPVLSNLGDLPDNIDNIDAATVQMLAERFRSTRCAARGTRTRSRRRNPWRPISHASGQRGAQRPPNIAAGLRELRSLQHANDRCVPDWPHIGYDRPGYPRRRAMQTQCCAPKPTNVRRGTAERRASGVNRRTVEKEPMSKICKAAATAALAATVTLLWAVTAGLPAAAEEQGTEQERQVCTPDVFRLCTAFIPDPNRIAVCLQQNISNLDPACRVVMNGSVQQR
jgi:hypothetical protein